MNELYYLKKLLMGNEFYRMSVGDTFDLFFDSFCLVAYDIRSNHETFLDKLLTDNFLPVKEAVDQEYVAKNILLTVSLRKKISDVTLNDEMNLELTFENNITIVFGTNDEMVDWQWGINKDGQCLFKECCIGVLSSGKVQFDIGQINKFIGFTDV